MVEPLLPDHHADSALDGWFGRVRREVNRWDMAGALLAVVGAVLMAALL